MKPSPEPLPADPDALHFHSLVSVLEPQPTAGPRQQGADLERLQQQLRRTPPEQPQRCLPALVGLLPAVNRPRVAQLLGELSPRAQVQTALIARVLSEDVRVVALMRTGVAAIRQHLERVLAAPVSDELLLRATLMSAVVRLDGQWAPDEQLSSHHEEELLRHVLAACRVPVAGETARDSSTALLALARRRREGATRALEESVKRTLERKR